MRTQHTPLWTVRAVSVAAPAAVALRREYLADVIASYWGRPATPAEVDAIDDGDAVLAPPTGVFLVGAVGGADAGCAGVAAVGPGVAELKRVYVRPALRGTGGGAALVGAAEAAARGWGARSIRLDTRTDLVAARGLYARLGYRDIAPFNDEQYAQVWLGKAL